MRSLKVLVFLALLAFPVALSAQTVGFGPVLGVAIQQGEATANIPVDDGDLGLNWGFFVNIPLLRTFHLSPSSEIYELGGIKATDMAMAFKFIVPLQAMDIHAAVVAGLTAVGEVTAPNVGVQGGLAFDLISNLDILATAKYKVLFDDSDRISVIHIGAGLLFQF